MTVRFTVLFELFIDGAWVDISDDCRDTGPVEISRGRGDEATNVDPGRCRITINNAGGVYTPRNPNSPHYGKIGRNTPLRVSVNGHVRFVGEVVSWPIAWDPSGADVYAAVEAAGIMRRLGQGNKQLVSPLRRAISVMDGLIAYWPMEDADGAERLASAYPGGTGMRIVGKPDLAATDGGLVGSLPFPTMQAGAFSGQIPQHTNTGLYVVRAIVTIPDGGSAEAPLLSLYTANESYAQWTLWYVPGGGLNGVVDLRLYDSDGTELNESSEQVPGINGKTLYLQFAVQNSSGSTVYWAFYGYDALTGEFISGLDAAADGGDWTAQVGQALKVVVGRDRSLADISVGHTSVFNVADAGITSFNYLQDPLAGYVGEPAGFRIQRLCLENEVPLTTYGSMLDTPRMGPQPTGTLLELLQNCAAVDGGVLMERRDDVGLAYRTARSMMGQE